MDSNNLSINFGIGTVSFVSFSGRPIRIQQEKSSFPKFFETVNQDSF